MKKTWKEFINFLLTGNLITLAVAFVMGAAVKGVVDSFIASIVQPFIGAIVGKPTFDNTFKIGDGVIQYGVFITAVINLVLIGAVMFMIVKAYEAHQARKKAAGEEDAEGPSEEVVLLQQIRDALTMRG